MTYLLAIDQGTTSSRSILFSSEGKQIGIAQKEFTQYFPADGWVEHDPEEIWRSTLEVCRTVLEETNVDATEVVGIGITNQRETTIVWDRHTGEAVYNAIVWQDRRTAAFCESLRAENFEPTVSLMLLVAD